MVRRDCTTAILEALKHLKKDSKLAKKALMVISDGGDNMSVGRDVDVIREADLSGALFYGIGIYDPMDGDANPGVMRKLAQATGGEVFFLNDPSEVRQLCENIARDLRSQYMISYAPAQKPAAAASNYRKIRVRVKDPKGRKLIVRTRTGYYANAPNATESRKAMISTRRNHLRLLCAAAAGRITYAGTLPAEFSSYSDTDKESFLTQGKIIWSRTSVTA